MGTAFFFTGDMWYNRLRCRIGKEGRNPDSSLGKSRYSGIAYYRFFFVFVLRTKECCCVVYSIYKKKVHVQINLEFLACRLQKKKRYRKELIRIKKRDIFFFSSNRDHLASIFFSLKLKKQVHTLIRHVRLLYIHKSV